MNTFPGILLTLFSVSSITLAEPLVSKFDPAVEKSIGEGLILHLKLDEGFADSSSKNHQIKSVGDVKIQENRGAKFDGDGDALELAGFDFADKEFSISFWIYVSGEFGGYGVFQQKSANKKREWLHFVLRSPMNPYLGFYMEDTKSPAMIRKVDGWRHVTVQYRDGNSEIWLDGKLDTAQKKASFLGKGGKFQIGKAPSWGNVEMSDFEGYLREFRVYNRSLTAAEIGRLALRR